MRKQFLIIAASLSILSNLSNAQSYNANSKPNTNTTAENLSKNFIGISAGLGSPFGNLGLSYGRELHPNVIGEIGFGYNVWGVVKLGIEGNYFINSDKRGFAFGLGFSRTMMSYKLPFEFKGYPYHINAYAVGTVNINVMYNFVLKRKHHFYIRTGYAIKLNKAYDFTNLATAQLGPDFKAVEQSMNVNAPGGMILGVGFRLGL